MLIKDLMVFYLQVVMPELAATNTSTTANVTFNANLKDVRKLEVFVHSTSSSGDTRGTCQTAGDKHTLVRVLQVHLKIFTPFMKDLKLIL